MADDEKATNNQVKTLYKYAEPILLTYGALDMVTDHIGRIGEQKNKFINAIILTRMYLCHPTAILERKAQFINETAKNVYLLYQLFDLTLSKKSLFSKRFRNDMPEFNNEGISYSEEFIKLSELVSGSRDLMEQVLKVPKSHLAFNMPDMQRCPKSFLQCFAYQLYSLVATRDSTWNRKVKKNFKDFFGAAPGAPPKERLQQEMTDFIQLGHEYAENPRVLKVLIAATYSERESEVSDVWTDQSRPGDDVTKTFRDKFPLGVVMPYDVMSDETVFVYGTNALALHKSNRRVRGENLTRNQRREMKEWIDFGVKLEPFVIISGLPKKTANKYYDVTPDNVSLMSPKLDRLEEKLQGRETLIGENVTFADIAVFCHLLLVFKKCPKDVFGTAGDQRPNIQKWYKACKELPAFKNILGSLPDPSPKEQPKSEDSQASIAVQLHLTVDMLERQAKDTKIKGYTIHMQENQKGKEAPAPLNPEEQEESRQTARAGEDGKKNPMAYLVFGTKRFELKIPDTHECTFRKDSLKSTKNLLEKLDQPPVAPGQ